MKMLNWTLVVAFAVSAGCSDSNVNQSTSGNGVATSSPYVTATEPAGAMPVGEARQSAKDGEPVTLVGRIGGSGDPFVEGLAAFTIVDPKVPCCGKDEGCPTPWDYCCTQAQVKDNIATVKIVDEAGKPVAGDARTLLGVKELSTVVVQGTSQRDDKGNLTIVASSVFVRPGE